MQSLVFDIFIPPFESPNFLKNTLHFDTIKMISFSQLSKKKTNSLIKDGQKIWADSWPKVMIYWWKINAWKMLSIIRH